jgi:hypothetical protein
MLFTVNMLEPHPDLLVPPTLSMTAVKVLAGATFFSGTDAILCLAVILCLSFMSITKTVFEYFRSTCTNTLFVH